MNVDDRWLKFWIHRRNMKCTSYGVDAFILGWWCLLVDLLESILFCSGDTGTLIHRKDIEFNPESFEVQKKSPTVKENITVSQSTSLNQQQNWLPSAFFSYLLIGMSDGNNKSISVIGRRSAMSYNSLLFKLDVTSSRYDYLKFVYWMYIVAEQQQEIFIYNTFNAITFYWASQFLRWNYWHVYPGLRNNMLLLSDRFGPVDLNLSSSEIKAPNLCTKWSHPVQYDYLYLIQSAEAFNDSNGANKVDTSVAGDKTIILIYNMSILTQ